MALKGDPQAAVFTVSPFTYCCTLDTLQYYTHTHTGTVYLISVAECCQYGIISSSLYVKQPVTMRWQVGLGRGRCSFYGPHKDTLTLQLMQRHPVVLKLLIRVGNSYLVRGFGATVGQHAPAVKADHERSLSIILTYPLMPSQFDQLCFAFNIL